MLDNLFSFPGEKIKKASKLLFVIGIISAAILLIIAFVAFVKSGDYGRIEFLGEDYHPSDLVFVGLLYLVYSVIVVLASYLSSLFMYGFGELVENSWLNDSKPVKNKTNTDSIYCNHYQNENMNSKAGVCAFCNKSNSDLVETTVSTGETYLLCPNCRNGFFNN